MNQWGTQVGISVQPDGDFEFFDKKSGELIGKIEYDKEANCFVWVYHDEDQDREISLSKKTLLEAFRLAEKYHKKLGFDKV